MEQSVNSKISNSYLRNLTVASYDRLAPHLVEVDLDLDAELQSDGHNCDWVYFPEAAVISLISKDGDGNAIESAMVGTEGACGVFAACGSGRHSVDGVVQVDGPAKRIAANEFRGAVNSDADLAAATWRLAEFQFSEARQSVLCQGAHSVEGRLARWLLQSVHRSGGRNPLPYKQAFLAAMLGVQRTTVTVIAGELQASGLINYARGRLEVVDPIGLKQRACDCHATTLARLNELSPGLAGAGQR